jgi:hypothetical protein
MAVGSTLGGSAAGCVPASTTSLAVARCCADDRVSSAPVASAATCRALGWTAATAVGSPTVCGSSVFGGNGPCSGSLTWVEANNFCTAPGARLCSVSELQGNVARPATVTSNGCGYNTQLLWTGTQCSGGFTAAYGSTTGGSTTACLPTSATLPTRCCANV